MSKLERIEELKYAIYMNADTISGFKKALLRLPENSIEHIAVKGAIPMLEKDQVEYEAELAQLTGTKNTSDV